MPPLHYIATSISIIFTSPGHFNGDKSSAGVYTLFHTSAETPGFLKEDTLIFFRLHVSGNLCMVVKINCVHGRNVPADEAGLHLFTPFPHSFLRVTSRSDARGNGGSRDSQQHPPYLTSIRQWPRPGKPHLLILLDVCKCFRSRWDPQRLS